MPFGFLESIAERYAQREYLVYGLPPRHPDLPPAWSGPFPDLLVQKGNERIAFFGPFPQPCRALQAGKGSQMAREQDSLQQWEEEQLLQAFRNRLCAAVQNPGVEIRLFCSSRNCPHLPEATACVYSRGILENIEIQMLQPAAGPHRAKEGSSRLMGLTIAQWGALGMILIGSLLITLLFQAQILRTQIIREPFNGPSQTYGGPAAGVR